MGEVVGAISVALYKDAPLLFVCFLTCLAEFLWFKHSLKEFKDLTEKTIEEIRKAYSEAYNESIKILERISSKS